MTSLSWKDDNRRATDRYGIKTRLQYRVADSAWKSGSTRNMSAGGLLIDIHEELAVGTRLEIAMDWTGLYHGTDMVRLCLAASVTRVDGRGTALRTLSHQFRSKRSKVDRDRRPERRLAVA